MARLLCALLGHRWQVMRRVQGRLSDSACRRCGSIAWQDYPDRGGLLPILFDLFLLLPLALVVGNLERFRLYRRLRGGVWERWYVEVCHSDVWHRVPEAPAERWPHVRPSPVCRGTPRVEDWR